MKLRNLLKKIKKLQLKKRLLLQDYKALEL